MGYFSTRYFLSLGNVAVSLVLGVVAFALCFLIYPDFTEQLLKGASSVKEVIVSGMGNAHYRNVGRFVLHESSIVLMGFTLAARIVVGALIALFSKLSAGRG